MCDKKLACREFINKVHKPNLPHICLSLPANLKAMLQVYSVEVGAHIRLFVKHAMWNGVCLTKKKTLNK